MDLGDLELESNSNNAGEVGAILNVLRRLHHFVFPDETTCLFIGSSISLAHTTHPVYLILGPARPPDRWLEICPKSVQNMCKK